MSLLPELFSVGLYKANQGRMVRQFTFFGVVILVAFGCLTLSNGPLLSVGRALQVGLPFGLWGVGSWLAFRAVNLPLFADFLISVESELARVTWPARTEVIQATVVVISTMFFLGAFLFVIDLVWTYTFTLIGFSEF
ncbi:MAG: preprotein translocase subunit SecE [Planctomycetia bacterium]